MLNVLYDKFPDSVQADGKIYPVRTDFRVWLKFADILSDKKLPPEQAGSAFLSVFRSPIRQFSEPLLDAVFDFLKADALYYHSEFAEDSPEKIPPGGASAPVFDWKFDSRFLLGDFLHFYHIDLTAVESLHWFKFRALFDALPENSVCMKRIAYRSADLSQFSESEKKRIRKIKRAVAVPYVMSDEEIGAALML